MIGPPFLTPLMQEEINTGKFSPPPPTDDIFKQSFWPSMLRHPKEWYDHAKPSNHQRGVSMPLAANPPIVVEQQEPAQE